MSEFAFMGHGLLGIPGFPASSGLTFSECTQPQLLKESVIQAQGPPAHLHYLKTAEFQCLDMPVQFQKIKIIITTD